MMEEKQIREELERTLANDSSNYSKILELSTKLASFDTDNIRFSVDAGIIDRLGTELVARQETAVSELVKNSYDADAKKVTLMFENSDSIGGTLHIEDEGLGMTREQLINGFMRISSTDKLRNPISERFNRNRAGQKGIEDFTSLEILKCDSNNLTGLDLSSNTALIKLECQNNLIANLDLSLNTELTEVLCYNNQLTRLNLTGLASLKDLIAKWNWLSSLDVSSNIVLRNLSARNNNLSCI
jgi:hypothetical protein